MKKQICILCRKHLSDGIIVNGKLICRSCEHKLVNSGVSTDFYEYYKECIKRYIAEPLEKNNSLRYQQYR